VHAVACPNNVYVPAECSAEQTSGVNFSPTDVDPGVTWFSDDTIGPGQDATVTVTDPTGGGALKAFWDNTDGLDQTTTLDRNGNTNLTLVDGTGTVTIKRCSTVDPSFCNRLHPAPHEPADRPDVCLRHARDRRRHHHRAPDHLRDRRYQPRRHLHAGLAPGTDRDPGPRPQRHRQRQPGRQRHRRSVHDPGRRPPRR